MTQRACHSDRIKPLAAIARNGEAFVHVYVARIESDLEVRYSHARGTRCVPAVRGERLALAYRVALMTTWQCRIDERVAHLIPRIARVFAQLRRGKEARGESGWAFKKGSIRLLHVQAAEDA